VTTPVEIPGLAAALEGDVYEHAYATTDCEVGGVFVGLPGRNGPPRISGSIRALHAAEHASELTFTQNSWEHIHEVIERDHLGRQIVGWYHTHPGYGLFLSEQDRFIHRNFFQDPGQIAVVVDPIAGQEAVYRWDGAAIVEHYTRPCAYAPPHPPPSRADRGRSRAVAARSAIGPAPPPSRRIAVEIDEAAPAPPAAAPIPPAAETATPPLVTLLYLIAIGVASGTIVWELVLK
jgi:proteasome lid subunit RPN8/RPN11